MARALLGLLSREEEGSQATKTRQIDQPGWGCISPSCLLPSASSADRALSTTQDSGVSNQEPDTRRKRQKPQPTHSFLETCLHQAPSREITCLIQYLQHPSFIDQSSERLSDLPTVTQQSVPRLQFKARSVCFYPFPELESIFLVGVNFWPKQGGKELGGPTVSVSWDCPHFSTECSHIPGNS